MKKLLYFLFAMIIAVGLNACSPDDDPMNEPPTEIPENPDTPDQSDNPENPDPDDPDNPDNLEPTTGKILIVYYSFTNNVHTIVSDLRTQIEADVIRVEPTEKGLDYAANNYAIGSAQIQAIRNYHRGSSALVEQYGGSFADFSVQSRCGDGRQTYRSDRIEFKQRHQRRGIGRQAVDSRWELPDAEPLDSFVSDIQLPFDDSPVAERYRLYGIKKRRYEKDIPASDAACSCDDFRRVQRRER